MSTIIDTSKKEKDDEMKFINKCLELLKKACSKTAPTAKIYALCEKNAELIRYVFCGGLTTLFNMVIYALCYYLIFSKILPDDISVSVPLFSKNSLTELLSNAVAWVLAVAFAFFINKVFVFRDDTKGSSLLLRLLEFYLFRVVTGVAEIFLPSVVTTALHAHEYHFAAKIAVSVFVIVVNYFFTKFVTFRGKKAKKAERESTDTEEQD